MPRTQPPRTVSCLSSPADSPPAPVNRPMSPTPGCISAKRAIEYADGGEDPYFKMHSRSTLGEVHFMLGDFPAAEACFQEAIAIDRDQHPSPPFLYSQGLFRYGYFLIETGQAARVLDDESKDPSHCPKVFGLMTLSVRFLTDGNELAAG